MNDINVVNLRGVVVNKFTPESTVPVTILTLSTPTPDTKIPNYPKVVFLNEEAKIAENINIYDHVEVEAVIQSRRKIIDGRKTYSQSLVGKTIKESEKTLETEFTGVDGGRYLPPENKVKIKGTIRSISKASDNVIVFVIETLIDGRHSFVRCFSYRSNTNRLLASYAPGTEVVCLGEVQTLRKDKDGKALHFENVVIKEIQKAQ